MISSLQSESRTTIFVRVMTPLLLQTSMADQAYIFLSQWRITHDKDKEDPRDKSAATPAVQGHAETRMELLEEFTRRVGYTYSLVVHVSLSLFQLREFVLVSVASGIWSRNQGRHSCASWGHLTEICHTHSLSQT